jgi:hypothetical protein
MVIICDYHHGYIYRFYSPKVIPKVIPQVIPVIIPTILHIVILLGIILSGVVSGITGIISITEVKRYTYFYSYYTCYT